MEYTKLRESIIMTNETERQHLTWLKHLAEETSKKLKQKAEEMEKLSVEVRQLQGEEAALEAALDAAKRAMGVASDEPSPGRFRELTVKQAAEIVMREAGGQIRTVDLVKALRDGGKDLGSKAYNVIVSTLQRDSRFRRVDRGVYKLAEKG